MEGKDGWCKNLPTAKNVIASFTWYHILMMIIVILIFYQTFRGLDIWMVVFYITAFFLIEDFLWFVFNPFYGIKKYKKENIPWHKNWGAEVPVENFIGLAIFLTTYIKTKFMLNIWIHLFTWFRCCYSNLFSTYISLFYSKIR